MLTINLILDFALPDLYYETGYSLNCLIFTKTGVKLTAKSYSKTTKGFNMQKKTKTNMKQVEGKEEFNLLFPALVRSTIDPKGRCLSGTY